MNGICAIISGGEYSPLAEIEKADYIIACDKGWEYALKEQITPQLLIGDFDSCEETLPAHIPTIILPKEKDDTDTLAAVRIALERGFAEIWLYCALGGRADHFYANLQTAAWAAENNAAVKIFAADTMIYFINNRSLIIPYHSDYVLSVFTINDKASGVGIKGAQYELDDATLTNTFPLGISNEFIEENPVRISVRSGTLMIMCVKV